jgi:exonuclease SbcD
MFRFVHAADLHLDSQLLGLDAREGAPASRIRQATREALRNIVSLCLEEEAAFLIIAGDVFDGDWKDFNTGLFFRGELNRLREARVQVFLIRGNHDSASEITRHLRLPEHVFEFSSQAPGTRVLEDLGVALHGYSFPRRAVTEDLLPRYPAPLPGLLNIGILHTSAEGSSEHDSYAPCSVRDLVAKGYQYWALGHVHKRAILSEGPSWVVFPGNPQGRHVREGGPRSVSVVTAGDGEVLSVEAVPTDVVRFESLLVELGEEDALDELLEKSRQAMARTVSSAEGRLAALRLRVAGRCAAHRELIQRREEALAGLRALALDFGDELWLEKVSLETSPLISLEKLREGHGLAASVLRSLASLRADPAAACASLEELLLPLSRSAGAELESLRLEGSVDELLAQVESLLASRLEEGPAA